MSFVRLLQRAFVSNLRTLTVSPEEQSTLTKSGIAEPTTQGYLAWRRSLMLMVVVTTLLSTGLATYREFTESDETPQIFENLGETIQETVDDALSEQAGMDIEDVGDAEDVPATDADQGKEPRTEAVADVGSASAQPKTPIPEKQVTAFGKIADFVEVASLYALSIASLLALLSWNRFQRSFRLLLAGFLVSFCVPMLIAFCPWSWWGEVDTYSNFHEEPLEFLKEVAEALLEGADYLIALLPTVLSLIPGVQRACLRIKTLLPESLLPGSYLVAAAPLYGLFLLVIFIGINQVVSDPIFLVGLFLFISAPAMYVVRADVFISPLLSDVDFQRMRRVQKIIALITLAAGGLLVYAITTQNVMGVRVFGLNPETSLLQPLDLVEFFLEFLTRSMFMTVFGADLFLQLTLANWRHQQALPDAERYQRVMNALSAVVK